MMLICLQANFILSIEMLIDLKVAFICNDIITLIIREREINIERELMCIKNILGISF